MTKLLEKAIAELTKLSEGQQDSMAQWILDELEDEAHWDQTFADSLPQLEQLAKKALEDYKRGSTEELNPDSLP
ncbi:MAG: hypothetical protein KC615_01885 [Anaerolineae bacterium]|nr:hypothetical protein [Anaerolineae bacterium]